MSKEQQGFGRIQPFLPRAVERLSSILLPNEEQTLFLRGCLHEGHAGGQAFKIWRGQVSDPVQRFGTDESGSKRLLPLFYDTIRRNMLDVDESFLTYLRAASFTEEIRSRAYLKACAEVLSILNDAHIPFIVLKGAAYAEAVYESPSLRHSGDLDLLFREKDLLRAADLLLNSGFRPRSSPLDWGGHHLAQILHKSGLPVELHRRLHSPAFYNPPLNALWERSIKTTIAGQPSRILAPVDMLQHTLIHAMWCKSQRSMSWVCDAWILVKKYPGINWRIFVDCAFRSKTELPLAFALAYMADEIQLSVPEWALQSLCKKSYQTTSRGRSVFVHGVRQNLPMAIPEIIRMQAGNRLRMRQLCWRFFPAPLFLRDQLCIPPGRIPFYYIFRLLRATIRRIQRRVAKTAGVSNAIVAR